jgi:hypothetical protein
MVSRHGFSYAVIVAFQEFYRGNGIEAIVSTSGRTSHIVKHHDGTWTVFEDDHHRVFPYRLAALDCARELAGDRDLPPLE